MPAYGLVFAKFVQLEFVNDITLLIMRGDLGELMY